jgi:hypothetical protein
MGDMNDLLERAAGWYEPSDGFDEAVERRARTRTTRRRVSAGVVALSIFAGAAFFAIQALSPAAPDRVRPSNEPVAVQPTEREQAEIFAFRAVASAGLMEPFSSRSFSFTYADDTSRTEDGWRVGFSAMDCAPRETSDGFSYTCRGLSGEDGNANPATDTYVTVALVEDVWRVIAVEGNVLPEERERVVGYTLEARDEPPHWEFPAAAVWRDRDPMVEAFALWVGPFPTTSMGSVCVARALDSQGSDLGVVNRFYQEPPTRPFERGGWMFGFGIVQPPSGFVDVVIECSEYTGDGWHPVSTELIRDGERVFGVRVTLEWRGDQGFTSPAECHVEVLADDGSIAWTGTGRIEMAWPPPDPGDYPYHDTFTILSGPDADIEASRIGSLTCRSL